MLLNSVGCPEWYPTLFVTTQFRNVSQAFNTSYAALSAIRQTLRWSKQKGINLVDRFQRRQFLRIHEIEALADFLKRRADENASEGRVVAIRPAKLERTRATASKARPAVDAGYAYSRLSYTAQYLKWLAFRVLEDVANQVDKATSDQIKTMADMIRARRPTNRRKTRLGSKKAQPIHEQAALIGLAQPDHPDNPFTGATARRNLLIVMLLDELGIRAGELLAVKVSEIDFQAQEIVIPRRHNDPEDPRANQPVAKTLDRRLAMSDELTLVLTSYVLEDRHQYPEARRHPFLLVSARKSRAGKVGAPLSRQAVSKLIAALSDQMPDGSKRVYPHRLRHNSATRFFRDLHQRGTPEKRIEQLLSWKFGWADGSGTARTYIESEIERQALEAQRNLQEKWKTKRE